MKTIDIQSREHLLNTLDGLSLHELDAVGRWRRSILDVCVQEMAHLAMLSNLTTLFEVGNERKLLSERLSEVIEGMDAVMKGEGAAALQKARESLESIRMGLRKLTADQ